MFKWQTHKSEVQAFKLAQKNAKLEAEKQAQTMVIKTQEKVIKNAKIKQKNEDSTRRISRSDVDEQLHQHNWFRDDGHDCYHGVRDVQSDLSKSCGHGGNETASTCSQSDL
ncbi:hypothetical protein RZ60_00755 [[Haemophilus] ducreyi]|uniref:Uncharacterized protein n=1 Tax=Haemophilus ducreyi TaxID=730 RepID=A0AAC8UDG6_HAEDC|nr:hypothetical protein RY60_01990 [[Haemophilus] ducreyi]AKO33038.1 hypothetical protein RZ57_01995 [[Haemophilus] ducreyi]AKO34486.1 hypothetical protein RZ58_01995 [[Haemophilus] ducreyi]AKO35924.1 hypothetical protein RZ59_01980 [[Haemophilus] ducreyi]AKO37383.1 hypothetical protein RZ61_01965 [[Haemophilus] ducreyi]